VRPTTLRLAPPLILTREQAADFVAFLADVPDAPTRSAATEATA